MMKKILQTFNIKEIGKFLVGGGSAVVVDCVVYFILKKYIDISVAKAISYVLGAAVGFVINKFWTFGSKEYSTMEIIKYICLYAFSALANTGVNRGVLLIMSNTFLAFLFATGTSTVINFLGQKFVVFHEKN